MIKSPANRLLFATSLLIATCGSLAPGSAAGAGEKPLEALFIGNSYTARHKLSEVVKAMAEAGNPGLAFKPTTIIYGGRRLADHWRLGSQNFIRLSELTDDEEKATIAALGKAVSEDVDDKYAKAALMRHRELLPNLESSRKKWDLVVLQSYRDDLEGEKSLYMEFAPKFAKLAKAQGARVLLYETTPTTQNAAPLETPPDPAPVLEKARDIAALADRLDVSVAPMSLVALRCQEQRPDLTLRFVNDAHLNQTLAYLTACTMFAAIYERSPVGLPVDSVTDIRFPEKTPVDRTKDRDGKPITRTFNGKDRADLQRIAWEAWKEFQGMRKSR